MEINLFEIILDIERSRSKFLDARNLRTKSVNLTETWSKIVETSILDNINQIGQISHLLFMRYKDEYIKTENEDAKGNNSLKDLLSQNIELTLQLLILLDTYRDFVEDAIDEPVLDNLVDAQIVIEENYQSILSFYLNFSDIRSDENVASLIQSLESHFSNIRIYDRMETYQIEKPQKSVEIDINNARFYQEILKEVLEPADDEFWFDDLLLKKFLNERIVKILEPLVNIDQELDIEVKNDLDKIKLIDLPSAKALSEFTTAQLLVQIAKKRINAFNLQESLIELKSALHRLDRAFTNIGTYPKSNEISSIYRDIVKLFEEAKLLTLLVEVNLKIEELLDICDENVHQDSLSVINSIKKDLISHDYNIDIQYLSAMPPLYDNIVSTLEILIDQDNKAKNILESINHNFENMERRIITATSQIVEDFNNISDENKQKTLNKVNLLYEQIEILQLTNSLLPTHIPSKNHNHNRLKILEGLSKSLQYELQAFFVSDENKIKELIFKTRAYHHANEAYFEFNNLGTRDVPIERIKAHYSGSFISSNRLQIELYKSISQFLCLSEVLPTLYLVMTFDGETKDDNTESVYNSWKNRFEKTNLFINILEQITRSSKILQEHRQIHGSIVSGIDWELIELIEGQAKGINQFLTALQELLLGSVCTKLQLKEDAVIHFTDAKQMGYRAAETLKFLSSTDFELKDAPTYIFNFAKFAQEASSSPSSHDLLDLPITGAFKLFRDLVFSL